MADRTGVADLLGPTAGGACSANRSAARTRKAGTAGRTTTWSTASSPPQAPNRLWLTDITEHWTGEGKLYLCAVKDVYSNRIVGYSIDSRMKARLAVDGARATPSPTAPRR